VLRSQMPPVTSVVIGETCSGGSYNTGHQTQSNASHGSDEKLGPEVTRRQRTLVELDVSSNDVVVFLLFCVTHGRRRRRNCFDVLRVGPRLFHDGELLLVFNKQSVCRELAFEFVIFW
jgi:hypothetical protein